MPKQGGCPYCGVFVKPENLPAHLRKAHAMEEEAARLDRATRTRRPTGRPTPAVPIWAIVVGVVVALAVATAVVLPNFVEPPPPPPLDEMCVQHDVGFGIHYHAILNITILEAPYPIPAGVGIVSDSCYRPLHTHEADNKIHVELPAQREVSLGDFFRIWGETLTPSKILTYSVDANHALTMTVNGVASTAFESHIIEDLQVIVLDYHTV